MADVNWNLAVTPDPFKQIAEGRDYSRSVFDQAALLKAGSQYAAGDPASAANTVAARGDFKTAGDILDAPQKRATAAADLQAKQIKAQQDYMGQAVKILGAIGDKKGPQALQSAFLQILPDLKALGTSDAALQQLTAAVNANPQGTLQALGDALYKGNAVEATDSNILLRGAKDPEYRNTAEYAQAWYRQNAPKTTFDFASGEAGQISPNIGQWAPPPGSGANAPPIGGNVPPPNAPAPGTPPPTGGAAPPAASPGIPGVSIQQVGQPRPEQETWGNPVQEVDPGSGKPIQVRYGSRGSRQVVQGAVPRVAGKPPPSQIISHLIQAGTAVEAWDRLIGSFNDTFAGQPFGYGEVKNWTGRNFGDSGQSQWWQDYQAFILPERQRITGSALTDTEKAEWDKAAIDPGMAPSQIKTNLARRAALSKKAALRQAQPYVKYYDQEAIEDALGMPLEALSGATVPRPPPGAAQSGDPLAEARDAIARGAPRAAVIQRLRQAGVKFNPGDL